MRYSDEEKNESNGKDSVANENVLSTIKNTINIDILLSKDKFNNFINRYRHANPNFNCKKCMGFKNLVNEFYIDANIKTVLWNPVKAIIVILVIIELRYESWEKTLNLTWKDLSASYKNRS